MVAEQDLSFDAEVSVFILHDGTALRTMTPYVNEIRGLPGQIKMNDRTTFGSVGERPAPSIYVAHFTAEFLFNMVTDVGVNSVLELLFEGKTLAAFEYYPAGQGGGNLKISGSCYLAIYEITSRVGSFVAVHTEFHVDNGVTLGLATG